MTQHSCVIKIMFEQLTPRGKQAVVLQGSQTIKAQHFTEGKVSKGNLMPRGGRG